MRLKTGDLVQFYLEHILDNDHYGLVLGPIGDLESDERQAKAGRFYKMWWVMFPERGLLRVMESDLRMVRRCSNG